MITPEYEFCLLKCVYGYLVTQIKIKVAYETTVGFCVKKSKMVQEI